MSRSLPQVPKGRRIAGAELREIGDVRGAIEAPAAWPLRGINASILNRCTKVSRAGGAPDGSAAGGLTT